MCFKTYQRHPSNQKMSRKKNNIRRSQISEKEGGGEVQRGMIMITDSMGFFLPLFLIKRCCKSSYTNCNTYIKLTAAATALLWCCQKIYLFTKKWTKSALNEKVYFFAFSHFNNFFVTHCHIPAITGLQTSFFLEILKAVCFSFD